MNDHDDDDFTFRELSPAELKAFAAEYMKTVTAEDLKQYENLENTIPFAEVIKELEDVVRRDNSI